MIWYRGNANVKTSRKQIAFLNQQPQQAESRFITFTKRLMKSNNSKL
jgi:hypothetical protein